MVTRRIPLWLRHTPAPSVRGFAVLAGFEAVVRGMLVSVFPLVMYRALGDAALVSSAYFLVGLVSLVTGLLVPSVVQLIPRRWAYTIGALFYVCGAGLAILGAPWSVVAALTLNTMATVITFVCFNAYVLDYISRIELGRVETSKMFYSALGWTLGPVLGVMSMELWAPAPFVVSAVGALAMLASFWVQRLGNGKLIARARVRTANPLAYLPRFFAQPRLVAGWLFAVIRSCGWWIYIVYLPIFAIQAGLDDNLGGILLSISNGALFLAPMIRRWTERRPLRQTVRGAFLIAAALFSGAGLAAGVPMLSVVLLVLASGLLIVLDLCGGLPFLMAVKPSERTEMSAIYSSYRDVSGILTPGVAWAVLLVAPVWATFLAGGAGLLIAWGVAGSLHPRLGQPRSARETEAPVTT